LLNFFHFYTTVLIHIKHVKALFESIFTAKHHESFRFLNEFFIRHRSIAILIKSCHHGAKVIFAKVIYFQGAFDPTPEFINGQLSIAIQIKFFEDL
jgi:hypothetical protein